MWNKIIESKTFIYLGLMFVIASIALFANKLPVENWVDLSKWIASLLFGRSITGALGLDGIFTKKNNVQP